MILFPELSCPGRSLKAHPFLAAFHSQCQSTDSEHLGLKENGLNSRPPPPNAAELAPRSNDDDSLGTNAGGERPIMVIYLIQILTAGEAQVSATCYPAVGLKMTFVSTDATTCGQWVALMRRGGFYEQLWQQISWLPAH